MKSWFGVTESLDCDQQAQYEGGSLKRVSPLPAHSIGFRLNALYLLAIHVSHHRTDFLLQSLRNVLAPGALTDGLWRNRDVLVGFLVVDHVDEANLIGKF